LGIYFRKFLMISTNPFGEITCILVKIYLDIKVSEYVTK